MSTSPTTSNPGQARFSVKRILVVALPCVAIVAGVGYYYLQTASQMAPPDYGQMVADYVLRFGPRANLDDQRYQDADGDLVADAPSDKSSQIDPKELVFTGIVLDTPAKAKATWKPLTEHLAQKLGRPVRFDLDLTSVEAQLIAMRDGKLHVTAFSTGSVPAAVNSSGFVPVCVPADASGKYAYQMEIIVPATSPVQSPADLKGRRVTFSSMSSNAGMKAPIYLLGEKFDLHLGKDYTFDFAGTYQGSIQGIVSGRTEAAPVANDVLRRELARGTIRPDQYRTIFTSEDFPPMCFGHGHNLTPELASRVREALLSFSWKGTSVEKEYGPGGVTKFVQVNYKKDWGLICTVDAGILRLAKNR